MACFGNGLQTINDCELLIKELIALGDNRPARIHALWREKEKHPRVPVTESPSRLDPGPSGHPVTWGVFPSVFPRQRLLSPVGTWLLPATIPCTASSTTHWGGSFPLPFASTFKYSESQLTGELGSKDSTKGKKCVQMAHGGDQHISHKFSPAQDAPAWRQRPRCGPEPGM